jgi:hypothetical protein
MDRLLVIPTYANDFGTVTGRRNIESRSAYDRGINRQSNDNADSIDSLASIEYSSNSNQPRNVQTSKMTNYGKSNTTDSTYSNGTRFTPMEFDEVLQPLCIRQPPSPSSGLGRNSKYVGKQRSNSSDSFSHFNIGTNINRQQSQRPRVHPVDRLLIIIRLHFEYYPRICCSLITILSGIVLYCVWVSDYIQNPVTRNRISDDYTQMDLHYIWQRSKIHHWCLWVRVSKSSNVSYDFSPFPFHFFAFPPYHEIHVTKIRKPENFDIPDPFFSILCAMGSIRCACACSCIFFT